MALLVALAGCLAFITFVENPEVLTLDWAICETPHALHVSHELLLQADPVMKLFLQFNHLLSSNSLALGRHNPADVVITAEGLQTLRQVLAEERRPLLLELQRMPDITMRTVSMIPMVVSLWLPTDFRFTQAKKVMETLGEKGIALADKVEAFLQKWWLSIPPIDNPIVHYKPAFVIHDFSKPPLSGVVGRG